ncbi:BrxA family protein [Methanocella sp. MCL-LM]|uniref:BrxA family protein n=1 Tax=Methanocella sp. MCL-LM TaxID=3412035 RepID=UPI003C735023
MVRKNVQKSKSAFNNILCAINSIKDTGPLAGRYRTYGSLIKETYKVFTNISPEYSDSQIKEYIIEKNALNKKSYATRQKVWNLIFYRYLSKSPRWVKLSLVKAAKKGIDDPEFLSLFYLYYCLRDRLTFEFVTGTVASKWKNHSTYVDKNDFLSFLTGNMDDSPQIGGWSEATRKKLATNTISALRDFGILKGVQKKYIQHPTIAPETIYHLICILKAEGKEGLNLINAPEWQLFLWNQYEVINALNDLAQRKWIRFEKSGKTVILEMIRIPEE